MFWRSSKLLTSEHLGIQWPSQTISCKYECEWRWLCYMDLPGVTTFHKVILRVHLQFQMSTTANRSWKYSHNTECIVKIHFKDLLTRKATKKTNFFLELYWIFWKQHPRRALVRCSSFLEWYLHGTVTFSKS